MKKDPKINKKLIPTTHIQGNQGNLYPKVTKFKYLGTNI